ncbi:hypothetical protein [Comamonas sp. JUb58]|uniref:hypothetical protein n=1 Tax=Comamonas sp. JUb58 TaxID=2485114 RepID=UPI0010603F62|nr:hypothetical protein [Comamonas sp. JUb58]
MATMRNHKKQTIVVTFIVGILILGSIFSLVTNDAIQDESPIHCLSAQDASKLLTNNLPHPIADAPLREADPSALQTLRQMKRDRLFDYSRSGNFADTHQTLKTALADDLISEKEYYGELAHMLHAPVANAHNIIAEIIKSNNDYGFEVMVSNLQENYELAKSMNADERQDVFELLNKNKPEMVSDMSLLGVGSVSKYTSWVGSLKAFSTEEAFVKNLNDLIENRISDPREAFGLYEIIVKKNYAEKVSNSALRKYNFLISTYKESYPENRMAELVSSGHW